MGKYNLLFQYLLRLKRVGLGLEDAWGALRRGRAGLQEGVLGQLWHVRQHMAHMVNNLQIYVQVRCCFGNDVAQSCFGHSALVYIV
jgi:gamma-tubulin complex component 4